MEHNFSFLTSTIVLHLMQLIELLVHRFSAAGTDHIALLGITFRCGI